MDEHCFSFNPRAHEGSTFRREANPSTSKGFNPRAHEGSTRVGDLEQRDFEFQPASP